MTRERGLVQLDAQTGALGDGDVAVADLEAGARDLTPASLEVGMAAETWRVAASPTVVLL